MSSYSGNDGDGNVEESWEVVPPLPTFAPTYDEGGLGIESSGLIDPYYFSHPQRFPMPLAMEKSEEEEEEEEEEEDISRGRNSPGWIDPTTPQNALNAALDEAMVSEEEGYVVEEVEAADSEGFQELKSGTVEPYCSFSKWWRTPKDMWKTKVGHMGALWSIAMVAAVMGFVILGRRWYHVRCHNKKLGIQVNADDKVLTEIGNFCICSIAIGIMVEIIVMYPIQRRKYRDGINNFLILLISEIPIAMPTMLSVTMSIGSHRLSQQGLLF